MRGYAFLVIMSFAPLLRRVRGLLGRRAVVAFVPFSFPIAALAQAAPAPSQVVVVTANRVPEPLSSVLADVSVIDRETIESSGASDVADVLSRLPGVEFTRTGGPGQTTSVFIRGAESRHTAVYIDGVRVDSQSTGGAPWEQIPLDQIDHIEVLRGPAAAVYGSDAIGGVVQLFTKRGQGRPRVSAAVSAGSYRTGDVQVGLSGSADAFDYSLSASHGGSDGFSARSTPVDNPDRDGWKRDSWHARLGYQLNADHRIEATWLSGKLRSQYDDQFSPATDDYSMNQLRSGGLSWSGHWSDEATSSLKIGQTSTTYQTLPSYYRTETTLRDYSFQHEQIIGTNRLTATVDHLEDKLFNPATEFSAALEGRRHEDALGLGWRGDFGPHGLQAHVRYDHDSELGGKTTGSLGWGWEFMPNWRVSASGASSFRAPTLYQRFSEYGNPSLVPESGRNVELGLRWASGTSEATLTAWRNTVTNLIDFGDAGPCRSQFGCYVNVGRARLNGATLAGHTDLAGVTLRGSIDVQDPKNLDTGTLLPRRARHYGTFGAETAQFGWLFGAELQATSGRFDNASNTDRLGTYEVADFYVSKTLMPGLVLAAHLDNAFDRKYTLAEGYATAGRNAQVSLRWTMQ